MFVDENKKKKMSKENFHVSLAFNAHAKCKNSEDVNREINRAFVLPEYVERGGISSRCAYSMNLSATRNIRFSEIQENISEHPV
jgi:hypothetical protein